MSGLKIVFGLSAFTKEESMKAALEELRKNGVHNIDTAHMYVNGQNEVLIGAAGAGDGGWFEIDTKNKGGWTPGSALKKDEMLKTARESLEKLKVKPIDIFYIHAPDRTMKLEEWVPTMQQLHDEGVYKRFGVSNFTPQEVKELHAFSKEKGYILPTVYQGNYSPVARVYDTELFPTLRELGIAFYAYSPLAGGFLTKTKEQVQEGVGNGRFSSNAIGGMYHKMYSKPSYLEALGQWEKIAEAEGCPRAELAYRWVSYHSPLSNDQGDAIILGASKIEHIGSSVQGLKNGPLKPETVKAIEQVWETIKHEAPVDNYNSGFLE